MFTPVNYIFKVWIYKPSCMAWRRKSDKMKEQRPISISVPMMESHSACGREHMHPCDNTTVTGTEKKKTKERIESPNVSRTPRSRRMRIRASCQILNELAQLKCVGYEGGVKEPSFLERALLSQLPSWASVSVPSSGDPLWLWRNRIQACCEAVWTLHG